MQPAKPTDDSDGETDTTDTDVDDGSDQTDGDDDGPFTPLDVELERAKIEQKTPSELLSVEPEDLVEALDTFKDSRDNYSYLDYEELFEYALERPDTEKESEDKDKIDYRVKVEDLSGERGLHYDVKLNIAEKDDEQ